ncbi:ParA family partition ATPase [Thiocystis violacea]|uniref:ParA family partition ATPase n=1 Tax=Thiocystis violacea TaxID=13725 RepID=UPI001903BA20|nr:ParA family partition ATPase [Thiocystis violacea]
MAKILTVANQKGGSGKTTVAMQLAGCFGRRDKKVLVIDADPQGTAVRWAASAEDGKPFPARVAGLSAAGGKVHREVQKFVDDYDYIVVDCPPAVDSPVPQSALLVSDLVLVPVIPSPADLWAATGIQQLISNIGDINEGLRARIVPNMCQPNTSLARDALDVLKDFGIPVTDACLHLRTAYRRAAVFGGIVHDQGAQARQAIEEVDALVDEVLRILDTPPAAKEVDNG